MYASDFPFKNFCKLAQHANTSRIKNKEEKEGKNKINNNKNKKQNKEKISEI